MIPKEAVEAAADAAESTHESWGGWEDVARAVLEVAAPLIAAQALEDAADELARLKLIGRTPARLTTDDEKADYWALAQQGHEAFLRARAATVRGGV